MESTGKAGSDARASCTRSMPLPTITTTAKLSPEVRNKTQSIPYKPHPASLVTNDQMQDKNDDMLSVMQAQFCSNIDREYPVERFVKHVWNFEANDHPDLRLKIGSFVPRPAAVEMYNDALNEVSSYPHLAAITDALLNHLFPTSVVRAVQSNIVVVDNQVSGQYSSFRPDLIWSTIPEPKNEQWDWVLLFAEVKRGEVEKAANAKGNAATSEPTRRSLKRKSPDSKDDDDEPLPKRRKQLAVSPHEAKTAKYLTEMLSHGIRSFASGFFIHDREMHLWYGDRMGLVKSCTFDWQAKPDLMALVFAAFGTANLAHLGISPFLEFSPISPKFESYEGGRIVLPASEAVIGDNQERSREDMVFKIDTTRRVWTEWGAVGRGTTVVPLEAVGTAAGRFGTEALVAKMAWPHAHRTSEEKFIRIVREKLQQKAPSYLRHIVDLKCFVKRNMEEMGLPRAFMDIGLASQDKRDFRLMVMKKYEHLESVESVDEFKTVFEHVVRAHHWVWTTSGVLHHDISTGNIMFYRDAGGHAVGILCDWDLAEEKFPDAKYEEDDNRIFRVHPMWPEDRTAATSLPDNIPSTIKQRGTPQTMKVPGEGDSQEPPLRPRYRTGTAPFIALEILKTREPPLHRYRHELESLFYLLAYVCALFNPTIHRFGPFNDWEQGGLDRISRSKGAFLTDGMDPFLSTFNDSHPDYKPLVEEWVMPLWILFSCAAVKRIGLLSLLAARENAINKGRNDRVAKLDAEIQSSATAWRKMITYEAFMDCLGLPLHLPTDPQCPSCDVAVSWCSHQA